MNGTSPEGAAKVAYDVIRWLKYFPSMVTSADTDELLMNAMRCPIQTSVFLAAQRIGLTLPPPRTQLTTLAAMVWTAWPVLESILKVSAVVVYVSPSFLPGFR